MSTADPPPLATITDSRRLTGANLYWDLPSAILDVACDQGLHRIHAAWQAAAQTLLGCVGHGQEQTKARFFDGGVSLLISAPVDALYAMCELNEVAFATALASLGAGPDPDREAEIRRLQAEFEAERNPPLLALQAEARRRDVPFLWDDDAVSVGHGAGAQVWRSDGLPETDDVDWDRARPIPVALVTGTNGKSTTVRMAAAMIAADGKRAGLTSTDWIRVGDTILDSGDYSGTGGARTLLRHPGTEVAVLETARGGLLRRGLGTDRASAALVTNVAADHLGDYGINTVEELREAKLIVRRALRGPAPLVLNADDQGLVDRARTLDVPIRWFSLDAGNPLIVASDANNTRHACLRDTDLVLRGAGPKVSIPISDLPSVMGGAARFNVANALGAMLLCDALGIGAAAITDGLRRFQGNEQDNPGRGNWFQGRGVSILVDFAHNEHGMQALADMVRAVPARRRILLTGQAGDRPDRDIRDMAIAACSMKPEQVLTCALPGYERGRPQSEVQQVIRQAARATGVPDAAILDFDSPTAATRHALLEARGGDLLVLLALTEREAVLEQVRAFIAS